MYRKYQNNDIISIYMTQANFKPKTKPKNSFLFLIAKKRKIQLNLILKKKIE